MRAGAAVEKVASFSNFSGSNVKGSTERPPGGPDREKPGFYLNSPLTIVIRPG